MVFDSYHPIGYQALACAFLIAWARVTGFQAIRYRSADGSHLLCVSLFLGFLFYEASVAVFAVPDTGLFDMPNLMALITHVLGICWNVSTVLLALQWQDGRLVRRKVIPLVLFAAGVCATLIGCAVITLLDPARQMRTLMEAATHPLGRVYAATYAACMLLTKMLVIGIVAPQIRRVRSAVMRCELVLIVAGSLLIACYAFMRIFLGFSYMFQEPLVTRELIPFATHISGGFIYVSGIALVELVLTAVILARRVRQYRLLLPLCRSGLTAFPTAGMEPRLRISSYLSTDLVNTQLLSALVLLLDIEVLLLRTGERCARYAAAYDDLLEPLSFGSAYHEELQRLLEVARRFRELTKNNISQDWTVERVEEALRIVFSRQPLAS